MVTLCQVHADHDGGQLLAQLVEPDIAKPNAPRGARWQWTMKAPPRLWVWFNLWRVLCVNLWQQIHIIWSLSLCVCVFFKAFDCSSKTLCILLSASNYVANLPMFCFLLSDACSQPIGGGRSGSKWGPYSGALSTSSHFYPTQRRAPLMNSLKTPFGVSAILLEPKSPQPCRVGLSWPSTRGS